MRCSELLSQYTAQKRPYAGQQDHADPSQTSADREIGQIRRLSENKRTGRPDTGAKNTKQRRQSNDPAKGFHKADDQTQDNARSARCRVSVVGVGHIRLRGSGKFGDITLTPETKEVA